MRTCFWARLRIVLTTTIFSCSRGVWWPTCAFLLLAACLLRSPCAYLLQASEARDSSVRPKLAPTLAAQTNAPTPGQPRAELPTWQRYVLWALAGFMGATSLGMVLNKRYRGLISLALIVGLAVLSIFRSREVGITAWPPIVCLALTVLCAGGGGIANKEFLERNRGYK